MSVHPKPITITAETGELESAMSELASFLAERGAQFVELCAQSIDLPLSVEHLAVIETADKTTSDTFELSVVARPSEGFNRLLAALRAGKSDFFVAYIE